MQMGSHHALPQRSSVTSHSLWQDILRSNSCHHGASMVSSNLAFHAFILAQAHSQQTGPLYRTYRQALQRLPHCIALSCCLRPSATLAFALIPGVPKRSREQNTMAGTRMLASVCPAAVKECHPCKVCVVSPGSRTVSAQTGERREVVSDPLHLSSPGLCSKLSEQFSPVEWIPKVGKIVPF